MSERNAYILYGNDSSPEGVPKIVYDRMVRERDNLAAHLGEYGVNLGLGRVMSSENGEAMVDITVEPRYDVEGKLDLGDTDFERVALDSLEGVVLDRWSANYGYGVQPIRATVLNTGTVQKYGGNKLAMHDDILRPLGLGIPTYQLHEAYEWLDPHVPLIAKLNNGSMGQGAQTFASMQELRFWASQLTPEQQEKYIVQPRYNFKGTLPDITPYSEADREHTQKLNCDEAIQEVRVYSFYSTGSDKLEAFAVPRATYSGEVDGVPRLIGDFEYYHADSEPLLEQLYAPTSKIMQRLVAQTKASAIYAAADYGYGTPDGETERDWHVIEVNTRFPFLMAPSFHQGTANEVRTMFAKQIAGLV